MIPTRISDPIQPSPEGWSWSDLRRGVERDDFHGTIRDKRRDEVNRSSKRLVKDNNVDVEAGEDWVTNLHAKVS